MDSILSGTTTMPYQYDVLVSVKWDDLFAEWVREHFLPLFTTYLRQDVIVECGRQMEGIFYYKMDIEPGEQWKEELGEAIRNSRCVLALCSPEYFFSDYCLLEWRSFSMRAEQQKKNLIIPVAIHDGDAFPDFAKDIQFEPMQEFVIVGAGFKETRRYVQFQDTLRNLSQNVARHINKAPEWQEWPVVGEALLEPSKQPVIRQETL